MGVAALPTRRNVGKIANVMVEAVDVRDAAVRLAALRMLLGIASDPATERELTPVEQQVARLLLSGRGLSDICNALGMSAAAAYIILIDLAR